MKTVPDRRGRRQRRDLYRSTGTVNSDTSCVHKSANHSFKPLTRSEVNSIVDSALTVLSVTGMGNPSRTVLDLATGSGCSPGADGRLLFPRSFIEDIIAISQQPIVLHGQHSHHDFEAGKGSVHFATGGAAVMMLDVNTRSYRRATLPDLYKLARIADQLENIDWFTRPVVATEIESIRELDLNTVYACAAGTSKHIGASITDASNIAEIIGMLDCMLGCEGSFSRRPFLSVHATTVVSPLNYSVESSDVATEAARHGMPILSLTGPQAGATAPAALAGTLVQALAESLAGLAAIKLVNRNHPVIVGGWPFVSDLRTGAFSGGGPEQALLSAAMSQIMGHCGLPHGIAAAMTDSKLLDCQAGYEKGLTTMLSAMAGPTFIYESSGMTASLLGCSLESLVIDNEMISAIKRCLKGINVTDETLSVDVIHETVHGHGHYLAHRQTLDLMRSEFVYPRLADRSLPEEWEASGRMDISERAGTIVADMLSSGWPAHLDPVNDHRIREMYPILLQASEMA